jgi:hypothetical protein
MHPGRALSLATAIVGAWLGPGAGEARADLTPAFAGVSPAGGGQFRYSYVLFIAANQTAQPFDFFTIYDIPGFVPGSNQQPANWVFAAPFLGPYPPGASAGNTGDTASLPNVTWIYNGVAPVGPGIVETFSYVSSIGTTQSGVFAGQGNAGAETNLGSTTVPNPEPGTLALFGAGALGLLGFVRGRRQPASRGAAPESAA